MKGFIRVTVADGCKALVPVENIEYVGELTGYPDSKAFISFKVGRAGFNVLDTFEDVIKKIEEATSDRQELPQ